MFERVLVANRGEIACRILRTLKRLGIESVAIYSDADAEALHRKQADQAERVGPAPVKESYLNIEAVLAAAKKTGATAVHPGYGLLSENASFAEAVAAAGLTFIGPSPAVLRAFGDKIQARKVARDAGVAPPPGSDGAIVVDDESTVIAQAEAIGYPVLVKAAGGGGGIGMQVVEKPDKLMRAAQACSDRGQSAFGDPRVYLERYLDGPRHIEVQVLGDGKGKAIALGERECSVQRRHQKIIEESPSPAGFFTGEGGAARRAALHDKAARLVASVKYAGAGTVEFVANAAGDIFFLEVNARLQVEHCVTEMVTGLDLVEQQLRIAAGEPLSPEANAAKTEGHSIEVRLYAEDPMKRFAPQPGHLERVEFPTPSEHLRVETGIATGLDVTPYYDPMLAKLVVWAPDRSIAIARMVAALGQTEIVLRGPVGPAQTNHAFLTQLLTDPRFEAGDYDTAMAEDLAKTLRKKG